MIEALERGLAGGLMGFQTGHQQARDFGLKVTDGGGEGAQEVAQQQEGAFLKALVEFVEAEFVALTVPEIALKRGMHPMDQHGHEQLAVEFAPQAVLTCGVGLMDSQHGF